MRITYSNIGSLGSGDFDLSTGLNAVVGPNGSGKSTLVNALYFAFTGETINGENLDSMITWGCSSCAVTVQDSDYSISRTVNINGTCKAKFCRGDITITRKKEIDQAICELFGFVDLSILRLVYFAEQYKAIDFVTVTDAVRVQLLSSLFGFSRLEKIRTDIQSAINSIDVSAVGDDVVTQIKSALKLAEMSRDKLILRQTELLQQILTDERRAELNDIVLSRTTGYSDALRHRIDEIGKGIQTYTAELESIPDIPGSDEVIKYTNIKRHTELSRKLVDSNSVLHTLISQRELSPEDISSFLRNAAVTRSSLQNKRQDLENQLGLLKSGKCPLTGGIPCPDLRAMTDEAAVNAKLDDIDTQIAQIIADEAEMSKEYSTATSLEAKISAATTEVSVIERELQSIVIDPNFSVADYEDRSKNADQYKDRKTELTRGIAVMQSDLAEAQAELTSVEGKPEYSDEQRKEAESQLLVSNTAESAIKEIQTMIPEAESSVSEQRSALQFAIEQNELAKVNKLKKDMLTTVRLALHRDNLPKLLVEDMLGALNSKLSQYLTKFNFPYEVTWSSGGAIMYTDGGEWHRASQLSGGQKYVLVISLRCALADLLSSSFPLFVLDEPTTGLDVANRESLSQVLSAVVQTTDRYLVVPTHDEMLLPEANIINVG